MIEAHLGDTIDIHGGGRDLVFPHHENEVAQSCCAHDGKEYVRHWMHNGYINIGGEKMSKSLGNFRTVRELLGEYKGEVIRCALLSAQYRSEMDFSTDLLDETRARLDSFYAALRDVKDVDTVDVDVKTESFYKALLDDLNTPIALGELRDIARDLNKASDEDKPRLKSLLLKGGELMGLLQQDPEQWFTETASDEEISADDIEALIAERQQAKLDKNYGRADKIREELKTLGVVLEDSREGTKWRRE
jgi:cysteinyl-tRNA synthetase